MPVVYSPAIHFLPSRAQNGVSFCRIRGWRGSFLLKPVTFFCSIFTTVAGLGCGIDWSVPSNHFKGVANGGAVNVWEKFAEIEADGIKLPLILNFRSDRENQSPCLGLGWMLPLLEAKITSKQENSFTLIQPDGWHRAFIRKGGEVFVGGGGWLAEIRESRIVAWADCGWRLDFSNDRIEAIHPPGKNTIRYFYQNDRVSEVIQADRTILKVTEEGNVTTIRTLSGSVVFSRADERLAEVSVEGKSVLRCVYTTSNDAKSVELHRDGSASQRITWDTATQSIISDSTWTYSVSRLQPNSLYAAITRTNGEGATEYWHKDPRAGLEEIRTADGLLTRTTVEVAGKHFGRIISKEEINGDGRRTMTHYKYHDNGVISSISKGSITRKYREDGSLEIILTNNRPLARS